MKNKLKQFWRVAVLAMVVLLAGCEKEVYEDYLYLDNIHKQTITLKELQQQHPLAFSKYQKMDADCEQARQNRKNIQGKLVYDDNLGFFIDTDKIIYMEKDGYKCYTFPIKREYEEEKVENLILSFSNNDDYKAFISKYNFTDSEKEMLKEGVEIPNYLQKMSIEDINGNSIITDGIYSRLVFMLNGKCYVVNNVYSDGSWDYIECPGCCNEPEEGGGSDGNGGDGSTSSGNSGSSDSGNNSSSGYGGNSSGQYGGSGSSGNSTGGYTTETGGTIVVTTPPNTHNLSTAPIAYFEPAEDDALIYNKECIKISSQLNSNPNIVAELANMANKTSDNTEWGRYKLTTASVIQTPPSTASGEVSFPIPASGKYVFMAHTHNSPASSTYSVFSWADLSAMAYLVRNNQIDTDNFVAYLATADGTYYALTIDNPAKFAQFITATVFDDNYDAGIADKRMILRDKYFDPERKGDAIIEEGDTDLAANEKDFVKFLSEANMGITLLESNATFTAFKKLSYNKNNDELIKQNCN